MAYLIEGLDPKVFASLFSMTDAELADQNARRVTATEKPGFPCRVTLEDAEPGESLILLNHVSHNVDTPYRSAHAIYVRESAREPARHVDAPPPVMRHRAIGLRGFDSEGMLRGALLALPGEVDAKIRLLFERPEIAIIHAHNAAPGCFAAKIVRH